MRKRRDSMFVSLNNKEVQLDPTRGGDSEHSQIDDAEEALVITLCALYLEKELANRAASRMGLSFDDFKKLRRNAIEPVTLLLGRSLGDRWTETSRQCGRQVVLKYICDGTLDPDCVLHLLRVPIAAPAMWTALKDITTTGISPKGSYLMDDSAQHLMTALKEHGSVLPHGLEKEHLNHMAAPKSDNQFESVDKRSSQDVAVKSKMDTGIRWQQKNLEETGQTSLPTTAGPAAMKNELESPDSLPGSPLGSIMHWSEFRAALKEKFNPHRIPCMYNVMVSTDTVEMVFFHTEGMASLFGIGLPFSKASVRPKLKILVEDMSEQEWRKFWMDSYEGSFKRLIFRKSRKSTDDKDVRSAASSTKLDLSITDSEAALNNFGVGIEGRSTSAPANFRPSTEDESESQTLKFRGRWMGWVDELLKKGKALSDWEKKNTGNQKVALGGDHGWRRWWSPASSSTNIGAGGERSTDNSGGEADGPRGVPRRPSTLIGSRPAEGANNQDVQTGNVKKLTVQVDISERLCKLTETPSPDIQRDLGTCFIQPKMTVEFVCGLNGTGGCSKRVNVTFQAEYQIGNVQDLNPHALDIDHPLKSGWYHNNLFLSFNCLEDNAARRDISTQSIVSKLDTLDMESMTNTQTSESWSNGTNREMNVGISLPVFGRVGGKVGTTTDSVKESSQLYQSGQTVKVQVLAEAPFFCIISKCSGRKMAYEAYLWRDLAPQKMWDAAERNKAKAGGMFATVSIKVQGSWRLFGDNFVKHQFAAQRELLQHELSLEYTESTNKTLLKNISKKFTKKRANKPVEKIAHRTLLQKISHDFTVNHNFSHLDLESLRLDSPDLEPYYWDVQLVDPSAIGADSCPVPTLIQSAKDGSFHS